MFFERRPFSLIHCYCCRSSSFLLFDKFYLGRVCFYLVLFFFILNRNIGVAVSWHSFLYNHHDHRFPTDWTCVDTFYSKIYRRVFLWGRGKNNNESFLLRQSCMDASASDCELRGGSMERGPGRAHAPRTGSPDCSPLVIVNKVRDSTTHGRRTGGRVGVGVECVGTSTTALVYCCKCIFTII